MLGKNETRAGGREKYYRDVSSPCCRHVTSCPHRTHGVFTPIDTSQRCCKVERCKHRRSEKRAHPVVGEYVVNGTSHRAPFQNRYNVLPAPPPRGRSSAETVQAHKQRNRDHNTPDSKPRKKGGSKKTEGFNTSVRSDGDGDSVYTLAETLIQYKGPIQRAKYSLADLRIADPASDKLKNAGKRYKSLNNMHDTNEDEMRHLKEELIARLLKEKRELLELRRVKQAQRDRVMNSRETEFAVDKSIIEKTHDGTIIRRSYNPPPVFPLSPTTRRRLFLQSELGTCLIQDKPPPRLGTAQGVQDYRRHNSKAVDFTPPHVDSKPSSPTTIRAHEHKTNKISSQKAKIIKTPTSNPEMKISNIPDVSSTLETTPTYTERPVDVFSFNERAVDCPASFSQHTRLAPPGNDVVRSVERPRSPQNRDSYQPVLMQPYRRRKKTSRDKCHTQ